jgi:excisionase family DNA binding protein
MHANGTALSAGQGASTHDPSQVERIAYTVAEVAALLGKHINTIYLWVQRGSLPAERIGGTIYIPRWALARLISPDADHVLATTGDRHGQLPGGRRAAYPAERAAQPLSARPSLADDQEVLPCW